MGYLDILGEPLALAEDVYYHISGPVRKIARKLKNHSEFFEENDRILIACHGWGQNGYAFDRFEDVMASKGLPVRLERFEYNFRQDIKKSAEQLDKKIKNFDVPVDLIGHSEGGLVIRYCLQVIDSKNVDTAITVATPHNGTALALPVFGKSAWQMFGLNGWKPAGFLDYLNSLEVPKNVRIINAYPIWDELVWPHNGRWEAEGVENIELGPGHVRAIMNENEIGKILSVYCKKTKNAKIRKVA